MREGGGEAREARQLLAVPEKMDNIVMKQRRSRVNVSTNIGDIVIFV